MPSSNWTYVFFKSDAIENVHCIAFWAYTTTGSSSFSNLF